jgi:hypothetical protein
MKVRRERHDNSDIVTADFVRDAEDMEAWSI